MQRCEDCTRDFRDFDTLGPGQPGQDLGELLRALATADEAPTAASVSQEQIVNWLYWVVEGYAQSRLSVTAVASAAAVCCLRQCERFLADHLAGDTYYQVARRGDNRLRAVQQLTAFDTFFSLASA